MELTANAPRSPDTRKPSSIPRADSVPVEPLSSWDGPGTAYTVMPRPAVPPPPAAPPPIQAQEQEPHEALPAAKQPLPTPKSSVNWPLIGGAAICMLLGALLVALWKPWANDNVANVPANQEPSPQPPAQAQLTDSLVEGSVTVTQEPMDDEPLLSPPSEPVPEQPVAALPEPAASAQQAPAPTTNSTVQAPPAQTQKQAAPTLPASPPPKAHPKPLQPMTIVERKPVAPVKPRSAPTPAAVGTLVVAVQPWAEIWVDGSKRGISPPLFKLQLPPGSYNVELRNPDLPSYSQKLQISAGQSVTLRHNFQ